jgi:hypothetical protein
MVIEEVEHYSVNHRECYFLRLLQAVAGCKGQRHLGALFRVEVSFLCHSVGLSGEKNTISISEKRKTISVYFINPLCFDECDPLITMG